jgi:hypothetical protein
MFRTYTWSSRGPSLAGTCRSDYSTSNTIVKYTTGAAVPYITTTQTAGWALASVVQLRFQATDLAVLSTSQANVTVTATVTASAEAGGSGGGGLSTGAKVGIGIGVPALVLFAIAVGVAALFVARNRNAPIGGVESVPELRQPPEMMYRDGR